MAKSVDVVHVTPAAATAALVDCMGRRARGERFYVRFAIPENHALLLEAFAPALLDQAADLDARRSALSELCRGNVRVNGQPAQNFRFLGRDHILALRDIAELAEAIAAYSESERRTALSHTTVDKPVVYADFPDHNVPTPTGERRPRAVVVWAARQPPAIAALFAIALCDLHRPVIVVNADPPPWETRATWVRETNAASALADAQVIVDASAIGTDAALQLARWGVPLVVDDAGGAAERIDGVSTYSRGDLNSIAVGVYTALGAAPPQVRAPAALRALPHLREHGPLATIMVLTHNRRDLLPLAIESVARQSYRDVEILVVNDGGERVDDIVEKFPSARLIHHSENRGPAAALNDAFSAVRGTYVGMIADDDVLLPDHVARLVDALERSGGDVAHANTMVCFLRETSEGYEVYSMNRWAEPMDFNALLITNRFGAMSVMMRKSSVGAEFMSVDAPSNRDYELWLRLASKYDYVYVDLITACYTVRGGTTQMFDRLRHLNVAAFEWLYERFPVEDRPSIAAARSRHLQSLREHGSGLPQPEKALPPRRWPLWV